MTEDIPQWVKIACSRWGKQKRRIWTGKEWYTDSRGRRQYHVDGYANSLLGRIREEREGAGQSQIAQHWPEVFWGDGLDVQRASLGMPEVRYSVMTLHYVWDPEFGVTAVKKARYLELRRDAYYDQLELAENWVWARLAASGCRDTQLTDSVEKIVREALQLPEPSGIKSHTAEKSPSQKLNWAALKRPKISIPA